MKTITYTNDAGQKHTAHIDNLIEFVRYDTEDRLYCVFHSYHSNYIQRCKTFMILGSLEDCLAYVLMFVVDAGHADVFEVGGPVWEITDDCADVIGSYDRLHIMPLFQAEGDRDLQHKMVSEIYATASSLIAVHRKCQINNEED